jgi:hypothetical protein
MSDYVALSIDVGLNSTEVWDANETLSYVIIGGDTFKTHRPPKEKSE